MNRNIDIYAAIYNEKEGRIDYIEDKKEQKMINEILKVVKEQLKQGGYYGKNREF